MKQKHPNMQDLMVIWVCLHVLLQGSQYISTQSLIHLLSLQFCSENSLI